MAILKPDGAKRWKCYLSTPDEAQHLEHVPGLFVREALAAGTPDALAVVAHRVGLPLPPVPAVKAVTLENARSYQAEGVGRVLGILAESGGALLADDMGLGKTRQSIECAKLLGGRVLVVCPAYVRETWREELSKWAPQASVAVLGPLGTKKRAAEWDAAPSADWVVVSYQLLDKALALLTTLPRTLIIDEAHMAGGRGSKTKNGGKYGAGTKLSQDVESAAQLVQYRIGLTGTPFWDRPRDFWRLARILWGARFGSAWDFDHAYCAGFVNQWGGLENSGSSRTDELKLRLRYLMVRREKHEVADQLPSLTRQVLWLDPTKEASAAFHRATVGGLGSTGGRIDEALQATLEGKLDTAVELAKSAKRFILFTYLKKHAYGLAKRLSDEGTPCVCITGDTAHEYRQVLIRQAETEGMGLVATIDALSTGVNLQRVASYGIMHALDWVPSKLLQAEARLHRLGQTQPVQWVYLAMKETMDAVVVNKVVEKLDAFRAVVGSAEGKGLRDGLGDYVDGAGQDTDALLKEIYDSL